METMNTMTVEEVDAEFAKVELRFHSYYKYTFSFYGVAEDGKTINVNFGGSPDDIYRYEVKANNTVPFVKCTNWNTVVVYDGERQVFEWFA